VIQSERGVRTHVIKTLVGWCEFKWSISYVTFAVRVYEWQWSCLSCGVRAYEWPRSQLTTLYEFMSGSGRVYLVV
jgi:hypothetical protein